LKHGSEEKREKGNVAEEREKGRGDDVYPKEKKDKKVAYGQPSDNWKKLKKKKGRDGTTA